MCQFFTNLKIACVWFVESTWASQALVRRTQQLSEHILSQQCGGMPYDHHGPLVQRHDRMLVSTLFPILLSNPF